MAAEESARLIDTISSAGYLYGMKPKSHNQGYAWMRLNLPFTNPL